MSDRRPDGHVQLGKKVVILDKLGAVAIRIDPSGDPALLLELGGRFNKTPSRYIRQYIMRPEQAAELVASLVVSAQRADPELRDELEKATAREQEKAIAREQERMAAVDSEWSDG